MNQSQRERLDAVEAKSFIWDECHKIFLCKDEADEAYAKDCGWDEEDLRPFDRDEIEEFFDNSCPLRAIWWMDESGEREPVIPQFDEEEI